MPSQPASGRPGALAQRVGRDYPHSEWALLTALPRDVLVAATAVRSGRAPRTVADGLAGLDAIAAGRSFDSDLVRAVVAAIYAESGDAAALPCPVTAVAVFAECRRAVTALTARADAADSAAYRYWVQHVAARALGGDAGPERAFLAGLGAALGLR